jgi:hypothetical protein
VTSAIGRTTALPNLLVETWTSRRVTHRLDVERAALTWKVSRGAS